MDLLFFIIDMDLLFLIIYMDLLFFMIYMDLLFFIIDKDLLFFMIDMDLLFFIIDMHLIYFSSSFRINHTRLVKLRIEDLLGESMNWVPTMILMFLILWVIFIWIISTVDFHNPTPRPTITLLGNITLHLNLSLPC